MSDVRGMLDSSPAAVPLDVADVVDAIEACQSASVACVSCADADVVEQDVAELRMCIALCLGCADLSDTTARVLSRPGSWDAFVVERLLQACVRACTSCADECGRHAEHHRHCAICAKACRACAGACSELLQDEALAQLEKLAGG